MNSSRRNHSEVKSSAFSGIIDQFDVSQHAEQSGIIITNMYLLWGWNREKLD